MENEIFKNIQYKDKFFDVGEFGTLLTKDKSRARKLHLNSSGYLCLTEKKLYLLHRIVAFAFCENTDIVNKKVVNHIDGNKLNNKSSNLEWVTQKENSLHCYKTLNRIKSLSGLKENWENPIHRKKVIISKDTFTKEFDSCLEASRFINVVPTAVNNCLKGRSNKCRGYSIIYKLGNKK